MRIFLGLVGCCAMVVQIGAQSPQTWARQTTDHFEIDYQPAQRRVVDAIAREAERAYARISFALQHEFAEKMPLIIVAADRDLPRNVAQARALVVASGAAERDHLLVSAETFAKRPHVSIAHDLTHQFVFELLPQAERTAAWVSEALPDHYSGVWESDEIAKVRSALASGRVPAVERLTAADRHWGHALFDFVAAEYGARGVRQYLSVLRDGPATPSEAIRAAFGVSAEDLNVAFRNYVRNQFAGP